MANVVTCPSGLSGMVRGMKVREERVLADRKLAKHGGQLDELLTSCWEETVEPGPYDFRDKPIDDALLSSGSAVASSRAMTSEPPLSPTSEISPFRV